ncbi:hypothetical protein ACWG0P_04140 [Amedibacillus sp. YH-ame6]
MNDGSYSTGDNVILFKCIKCARIEDMDKDIACEVLDVTNYKGERCYFAYCAKCNSKLYPAYIIEALNK